MVLQRLRAMLCTDVEEPRHVPDAPRPPLRVPPDEDEAQWLAGIPENNEYVAFIDVLGYRALLSDAAIQPETARAQYLYDAWSTLLYAFHRMLRLSPDVEAILFS